LTVCACSRREAPTPHDAAAPADPPRVVLLLSLDTLRPDHLGFYGYERFTSPVLDEIARDAVVFEDANAAAPWTLPSHASMLTGLYPLRSRVTSSKTRLPDGIPTLASMLARHGYDTAAVVNVEWLSKDSFQLTREFASYLRVPTTLDRKASNTWVTDQAIDWLEKLGDGRLFLFAHYYDLHSDYAAEPSYERLFSEPYEGPADGTGWQLLRAVLEEDYIDFCHRSFDKDKCAFGDVYVIDDSVHKLHFDADDVRHLKNLYDAQIRQLDTELSRLFTALRNEALLDDTLLIVTSDHGEEFMEHGRFEHFIPTYQQTLHIPLLLRGPGLPRGIRIGAPVSNVDIVPTVLRLVGAPLPEGLDGLDLSPLWSERAAEARSEFEARYLYGEASGGISYNFFAGGFFPIFRSVRQGRYKLLHESKQDSYALYDLREDPGEKVDVASREPEITERLIRIMNERYEDFRAEPREGEAVELSPEDAERLRALGYVP
jgi:arylsulfatase A-like enzyme